MTYIQWKVKADSLVKTFDNEPQARRQYGKFMNDVEDNEEGFVELYARENFKDSWTLIQECRIVDEEDESEEEEEE